MSIINHELENREAVRKSKKQLKTDHREDIKNFIT